MSAVPLHLYEITDRLGEIATLMAESGGELTPELEAELDAAEGALKAKAENIIGLIRDLEGSVATAKAEVERITRIKKARENTVKGLRAYLLRNLLAVDVRKLQTDRGTLSVTIPKPKPAEVHVTVPIEYLPDVFRKEVITYVPNLELLRECLEAGDPEAEQYAVLRTVEPTPSLRIL